VAYTLKEDDASSEMDKDTRG